MTAIPFNRPFLTGQEIDRIGDALARGDLAGDGAYTARCEEMLERLSGAPRVMLTTSCTDALMMSGVLLDVAPGSEVIVPSFSFTTTAGAFALRGARPVFIDSDPTTFNIDVGLVEERITERTRAIVPVHYGGVACEMGSLMAVAEGHGIPVVEDNAHGLYASYDGRPLGSLGRLGALSFHATKNLTCGEGGALIVNDPRLVERAETVRQKGTDRARFLRGDVDQYTWVDLGVSSVPSDILAAFLSAQLEAGEEIQGRRRAIWERYDAGLHDWAGGHDVRTPVVPVRCAQSYHMYHLLMPSGTARDRLIDNLASREIQAAFHFVPLHLSAMGRSFAAAPGDCPVAEDISRRLVRLPFYTGLAQDAQDRVIEAVRAFVP